MPTTIRYAAIYGLLSGGVIVTVLITGLSMGGHGSIFGSLWFGYLTMLVALSFIFVGVKRFRDVEKGGVIRFLPAFGMGLAISVFAGIAYVAIWETYLAATGYRFMDEYIAHVLAAKKAAGASAADLAREAASMNEMRAMYANPLARCAMTFVEIFPVGAAVSLITAAIIRNPRILPARR